MAANMKMTAFCDISPYNLLKVDPRIALMMDAVRTSETSVYFYETALR
jgi:hypothetical protein